MSPRPAIRFAAVAAAAILAAVAAPARAAEWRQFPLPPPPGGEFSTPVGVPGDLDFWAPNRGLLTVAGNNAVPEGIYSWDGVEWHQLAVVCGGPPATARIAWAGPREFWTITRPSLPRPQDGGVALCHFKDGAVVGSFSTPPASSDPYHGMRAAACLGPTNCWFGGSPGRDGTGQRRGAFHLHWDGSQLRTVYGPQGRPVTDLLAHGNLFFESTEVGSGTIDLQEPEDVPRLLHRIEGGVFVNDAFLPEPLPGVPSDGTVLRALDGDGQTAWAVGGTRSTQVQRPPLAARFEGGRWVELDLRLPSGELPTDLVFTDVAAVPGTRTAWVTVQGPNDGPGSSNTRVALIEEDGLVRMEDLALPGDPVRGAAMRIACPAAGDCWLATGQGFLYRRSDAGPYERDTDPAFQGTITHRPNEAAEQAIPDTPPEDDSRAHAPPVELRPETPSELPPCRTLPALLAQVKAKARGRHRLVVRFRLRRRARVGLVALHRRKVVARARPRPLRPGRRRLAVRVSRRRWPTRLRFVVRDERRPPPRACMRGADGDTLSTGGDTVPTSVRAW